MENNENRRKKKMSENKWLFIFAILCLLVVAGAVFATIFYINIIQTVLSNPNSTIGVQSSTDILNLSIPILAVFAGLVVSFLGLKKFETIDEQLNENKQSIENRLEKEINEINAIKKEITSKIDANVTIAINDKTSDTIELINNAKSSASEKIKELEDSVLRFLEDYQWLIDSKEALDKIQAHNIAELWELIKKAFSSKDTNDLHMAIATVQKVIAEQALLGNENHFFNLASDLARNNYTKEAVGICKMGLNLFPDNLDILSSLTLYCAEIGNLSEAKTNAEKLEKIDSSTWNWRAFTFAINYYKYLPMNQENKIKLIEYVNQYKDIHPKDERAYMAECEVYRKYGMQDEAIAALEHAMGLLIPCPQCAAHLAEYYLDIGNYRQAIVASTKSIIGNAQVQESVATGASYAFRGLAKDALIFSKIAEGTPSIDLVDDIVDALKDLAMAIELGHDYDNIRKRIIMLQNVAPINFTME